jgi:hypothetical protein
MASSLPIPKTVGQCFVPESSAIAARRGASQLYIQHETAYQELILKPTRHVRPDLSHKIGLFPPYAFVAPMAVTAAANSGVLFNRLLIRANSRGPVATPRLTGAMRFVN